MSARLFLLDTDISIYLLNGRLPAVEQRLASMPAEQWGRPPSLRQSCASEP